MGENIIDPKYNVYEKYRQVNLVNPYRFGSKLFIDEQPNATFYGFSLRKLTITYNGNCIKVRRSSDNTELDVGFNGNILDTVSLLTFIGGGNGYVSIWYDQSGNSRNATQTIQASQPQIVSSGMLLTENGKPTVKFTTTTFMNIVSSSNIDEACVCYVVSIKSGTPNYYGVARHTPPTGYGFALFTSFGITSPGIVPFLNGSSYYQLLKLFAISDTLPTSFRLRIYSIKGSSNIDDSVGMHNDFLDVLSKAELSWGTHSTSGINLGYNNVKANMNLSELVVFGNANRSYLSKLSKNSIKFYSL